MKQSILDLPEATQQQISYYSDSLAPQVLPGNWRLVEDCQNAKFYECAQGLKVISEVECMDDGSLWLHVSFSRRSRLPDWRDLQVVKTMFVGRDRKAIQVFPREAEYVNIHPYCLHLYSPLGFDPLPDFRAADGI